MANRFIIHNILPPLILCQLGIEIAGRRVRPGLEPGAKQSINTGCLNAVNKNTELFTYILRF